MPISLIEFPAISDILEKCVESKVNLLMVSKLPKLIFKWTLTTIESLIYVFDDHQKVLCFFYYILFFIKIFLVRWIELSEKFMSYFLCCYFIKTTR